MALVVHLPHLARSVSVAGECICISPVQELMHRSAMHPMAGCPIRLASVHSACSGMTMVMPSPIQAMQRPPRNKAKRVSSRRFRFSYDRCRMWTATWSSSSVGSARTKRLPENVVTYVLGLTRCTGDHALKLESIVLATPSIVFILRN
jgi:hypothetical protein